MTVRVPPDRLVPTMVRLTPSSFERWLRCHRLYLAKDLLGVPASDVGPDTGEGLRVHALLRYIHERGSCHDTAHVEAAADAHAAGDPARLLGFVSRHARRCPLDAHAHGHEHELARFHRQPGPIFMATARVDALWEYGGVLEARDYKTGMTFVEHVGHDPAARLHAWLIAPIAQARGLQVRIRYEHLAAEVDDDPDPFEPDAFQLDAIEEELRAAADSIRAEREFRGVADPHLCIRCAYRSICPDSAHLTAAPAPF